MSGFISSSEIQCPMASSQLNVTLFPQGSLFLFFFPLDLQGVFAYSYYIFAFLKYFHVGYYQMKYRAELLL